ncbi:MAG: ArsR/SmtB family transcription factor [Candidatus Thorarchaeota archaeon]
MKLADSEIKAIVRIFKALADETRMRIISSLSDKKVLSVSEIKDKVGISLSGVSHHLSKLEHLGFVKHEQVGKKVFHSLDDECIESIIMKAKEHVHE